MRYRTLGRTGLRVSEVGYGAWGIGGTQWVGADDQTSLQSLRAARELGVNFFDTALAYNEGHSEELIAEAFADDPDVIIATKVPPKNRIWPAVRGSSLRDVFPRDYVLDSLEKSRRNLRRKTVDLFQFHVWDDAWAGESEWLETIRLLRHSGHVRFIGISINDHQPANVIKALGTGLIDVVQVIFNVFDQSPLDQLLPYCAEHEIGVIARCPFDEGGLTGKIRPETQFPQGDFREVYFGGERKQQVWERVQRISEALDMSVEALPEVALRFILSFPAVSTVIPGMRNPAHARANVESADKGGLSSSQLRILAQHRWIRNFYAAA